MPVHPQASHNRTVREEASGPRWGWLLANIVMSVIAVASLLIPNPYLSNPGDNPLSTAFSLATVPLIWLRTRWPAATLLLSTACFCVTYLLSPVSQNPDMALAACAYSLTRAWPPRRALALTGAAGAITCAVTVITSLGSSDVYSRFSVINVLLPLGFAVALGSWARVRHAYILEIKARAEHAEATRDSEAARQVAEERLRVARDLHDIVAHQITVISLHAGLASTQLEKHPDQARESLATVRSASRRVLIDIGNLLAMLRDEESIPQPPRAGLADLDELIAEFQDSGLEVELQRQPDLPELSPSVDHVVYQILREGLTNALRHGCDGKAAVTISSTPHDIKVAVTNRYRPSPTPTTASGHGLNGIRERVASVRGTTDVDDSSGSFRLTAWLPAGEAP